MNILSNAVDDLEEIDHYTYAGTRIPSLTIKTEVLNPDWIAISIGDNGLGISDEIQQQIFDPFFTTKPVGQGTGLGLSITYGIIEKHTGSISCQSKVGEWSEFTIELPNKPRDDQY
jgi:signal transduction histidine kinase